MLSRSVSAFGFNPSSGSILLRVQSFFGFNPSSGSILLRVQSFFGFNPSGLAGGLILLRRIRTRAALAIGCYTLLPNVALPIDVCLPRDLFFGRSWNVKFPGQSPWL